MTWYLEVIKKYAVFTGRSSRKEYWYFILFCIITALVLSVIDALIGIYIIESNRGLLSGYYNLSIFIPSIAVSVRRLHDISLSGWWVLITLIPLLGGIIFIYMMMQNSTPDTNQYGKNPKEAAV